MSLLPPPARGRARAGATAALLATVAAFLTPIAGAAKAGASTVITVNTVADSTDAGACGQGAPCSLRDAINAANQLTGPAVISIPAGTYQFSTALPSITQQVTVQGAGAKATVIQGTVPPGLVEPPTYAFEFQGSPGTTFADAVNDLTLENTGIWATNSVAALSVARVRIVAPPSYAINSGATSSTTVDSTTISGVALPNYGYGAGPTASAVGIEIASFTDNATITNTTVDAMATDVASLGVNLTLTNDTLTGAWGGGYLGDGLANYATGTVVVRNTLLANNVKSCDPVGDNPFTATDHNVETDTTCGFTDGGNIVTSAAGVAALGDNGGPVATEALLAGSPAIGAADASACPATDARGVPRPSGGPCDVGAYQSGLGTKPVSAGFSWKLEDRFGPKDEYGLVDYHYCAPERGNSRNCAATSGTPYTYDPKWVHPATLTADFDGCANAAEEAQPAGGTLYDYRWVVVGTPANVDGHACKFSYAFPVDGNGQGTPTEVRLIVTDANGNTPPSVAYPTGQPYYSQTVTVRDLLVVSFGDSYGSGEGTPDVAQQTGPCGALNVLTCITVPAQWEDQRCHRSAAAGPAQAALQLEAADPHTSVTFVSFACSGATIETPNSGKPDLLDPYKPSRVEPLGTGVLGPYRGIDPPSGVGYDPSQYLPPQVSRIAATVGSRRIDALVASAGGNDMGFSKIATVCVLYTNCVAQGVTDTDGKTIVPLAVRVQHDAAGLGAKYADLAAALNTAGVRASKLYITEYPDPTRGDDTTSCSSMLGDVMPVGAQLLVGLIPGPGVLGLVPPFQMDGGEVTWAGSYVSPTLNGAVLAAAQRYSTGPIPWRMVSGIAADFQSASGHGHGYCSSYGWIRTATDSANIEGPLDTTTTTGTLHPNAAGGLDIGQHVYATLRPDLLPAVA